MFTGIIEAKGIIREIRSGSQSLSIAVTCETEEFELKIGGSVSVDGVCVTVESYKGNVMFFTAVAETLSRTTLVHKRVGERVNLERSTPLSGRLDGHIVLGHVDGVGVIAQDRPAGDSIVRTIRFQKDISRFLAEKGSVSVDGISLTIARASMEDFDIALIPFTFNTTTMALKRPGDRVNIECDVLARYVERLLAGRADGAGAGGGGSLFDKLERSGY